ncbi:putative UHRF1-binding protein [Helianthus annuus]|uniref:UHRF1-binding protein n=2 Tax=Helianthus annuus TaxID=4232 RepID=A0A251T965_HELAN|nr:uncharacterized protein LOC110889966 isoform X1 [Helianthus annuus]KAF5781080.1 putative UHRF1-binding protein [Helianthus annuus]KAJ0508358.1 putative UHRF1-binding protein [Helianthus annuus]KAJ0516630.1 putative UHRF1-binding protein [Helianthus annuus]KAJ0874255.1 putative UHRF1-binding protein [Helianthus annuus]
MESILARALEYTLKYWLKSFTRDQFKLQGRTVQLSNLDINGDALHASLGLPPALNVTTAKVGKLEIILPYFSNVQVEPIVVQIDKLDLVLEENDDLDAYGSADSAQTPSSPAKGSGYGFADKIADGMTLEVRTVNLLLETHGGARRRGGATWASPMASITIRNLLLYTTNENWQVVNLKEARDFSNDKKFIYVFKKLEWEHLSIDLLPHPDMFAAFSEGAFKDDDGAKRVFFGGERFLEGISGEAYITIQRTELNSPLGLELQLHITEAVCPALSEPGLRALLRFFTGLYVCLNRGDVNPHAQERSAEAAGRTLVSIMVDHIFFCIKDTDFRLELLMQSLFFSRASLSDGEITRCLTRVMIGGLFLRDTFSSPPCALVQPSMQDAAEEPLHVPDFGKNFCPPIYPLGDQQWRLNDHAPLISLHSLQFIPAPTPPSFSSQTVIDCQPLMIHLQEESCLRISSLLADGILVNHGDISPDFSISSLEFKVKGLDITVPLVNESSFTGARLHIENLYFQDSPSLRLKLLNLDKDPACFCLWKGQPIDSSQRKWTAGASLINMSLETHNNNNSKKVNGSRSHCSEFWRCVEMKDVCVQVAMVTADGSPLTDVPPPGGVVRVGVACEQYLSNTSVEQLFFVLDLYTYFGTVSEKLAKVGKDKRKKSVKRELSDGSLIEKVPGDTAVSLSVKDLMLTFLESSSLDIQGMPLVQFIGDDLFMEVTHRTLGGAMAISSTLRWDRVQVDCTETEENSINANGVMPNDYHKLRAVFWVQNGRDFPFLDLRMVHVIPYNARDTECHSLSVSACIAGVRLAGGMNYAEALLHRFGILGPDGGPGVGLSKGLEHLSSGPFSKLFKASPLLESKSEKMEEEKHSGYLQLGPPDDVDVSLELRDWLFALEGAEVAEKWRFDNSEDSYREERCWHTTFDSFQVKANSSKKHSVNSKKISPGALKYPVESVTVGVEGLKTLKPQKQKGNALANGHTQAVESHGGVDLEADIVLNEDDGANGAIKWVVESLKFSVKHPVEAIVTKDELQHVAQLCKSEVDSMGRITAGVLRVLKLEGSVGQTAMDQLSNLGSEGFDNIFSHRYSNGSSVGLIPSSLLASDNRHASSPDPTLSSLEAALLDSKSNCAALAAELSRTESSKQHLDSVEQLAQKLESMQKLLSELQSRV